LLTPTLHYHNAIKDAAAVARSFLGLTSPNPAVGAVALNAEGQVIASAAHTIAGQPHAEVLLLQKCRELNILRNIDVLGVTLEPCNHHGRTPPCTEAIIASGIKKMIIGTRDPNPHVKGGGIERLQSAGIEILCGINEGECRWLIHAFSYHAVTGKPWITVKRALTSKGSMIPPHNQKTFTSPNSLKRAHLLRKKAGAILTGSGTILKDNPLFTVRNVPDYNEKKRYLAILDRRRRVPDSYLKTAASHGLTPQIYDDFETAVADLSEKGVNDILVEAGPTLSDYVLQSNQWTMSVNIQQNTHQKYNNNDTFSVEFSPLNPILSGISPFEWHYFLPE